MYGAYEIIKKIRILYLCWFLVIIFSTVLFFGFYFRAKRIYEFYITKKQCNREEFAIMTIGKWLEKRFPSGVVIWKDSQDFYISPLFKNVFSMPPGGEINKYFAEINNLGPGILVITNQYDPELKNIAEINKAVEEKEIAGYKIIKIFRYRGPLELGISGYGKYKQVNIYEKITKGVSL
jgi:hypothetical protein